MQLWHLLVPTDFPSASYEDTQSETKSGAGLGKCSPWALALAAGQVLAVCVRLFYPFCHCLTAWSWTGQL